MGLSVNRLSNENNYENYRAKANTGGHSAVSMKGSDDCFIKEKESNDGKFSFSRAMKNFGEGLVSPITSLFSSPKDFVMGAGMIAGSIALVVATGGAAAPILVAAGVGMGVIQAGKAVVKIIDAKNGDDVEKAFYDVGGATSTIGLSLWGAKGSLKQANIKVGSMDTIAATKKCFTSSKDLAVESFDVFKSGYYKTNIANAVKTIKQPSILKKYARELYKEGEANFEYSFQKLKDALPKKFADLLKGRHKGELSIYEKMVKERTVTIDDRIAKAKKRTDWSDEVKQQAVEELLAERKQIKTDPDFAKAVVEDLFGARMTLDDVSPANIEEFVTALTEAMKKGDIEIFEIENYRGYNKNFKGENEFYFTEEQVSRLDKVSGKSTYKNAPKHAGYSAVQLKIKPKGGRVFELQIRGKEVDAFADIEHIPYDLRQGKDIANGNNKAGILLSKVRTAIKGLDEATYCKYKQFIYDNYIYAQAKELGKPAIKPTLPEGIDPILSAENLELLHKSTKGFKSGGIKNPLDLSSQLAFISGTQGVLNEQ